MEENQNDTQNGSGPKVSIVVTCYNLGGYLQEALDSIAAYANPSEYEVIIVDDGSTDPATIAFLNGLPAEKYRLLRQHNQGLSQARNNGIAIARGPYIVPFDADNRLRPAMIREVIAVLDTHPEVDIVHGDAEYFEGRTGRWVNAPHDFKRMIERNRIDACAGYRRTLWARLGGYDTKMRLGLEDWEFWLRAAVAGARFHYVPEILFDYRVRTGSMLSDTVKRQSEIVEYVFQKPELAFLRSLREHYLELLGKERDPKILTGRDHLRLLLGQIRKRLPFQNH